MTHNFDPNQNYYSFIDNSTEPLVFIHGVGLDHKMWDSQIKNFKEYSTIAYDLLGHGKTSYNKKELSLNDFSNQLNHLLKFLKKDKINLIGFSLGSLIALDFASKFQNKLKSLTLIGTTYKIKTPRRYDRHPLNGRMRYWAKRTDRCGDRRPAWSNRRRYYRSSIWSRP